jgi:hypothetical protein
MIGKDLSPQEEAVYSGCLGGLSQTDLRRSAGRRGSVRATD